MNKKKFLERDRMLLSITEDGSHRISIAKTTNLVLTAQSKHALSPIASVLLGRTLTACSLLASSLKGEERIQLKLEGNGPLQALIAEASRHGEVRGYALNPSAHLPVVNEDDLGKGLGIGVLSVSKILYNKARPVTGTVEMVSGNVNEDLAHYLYQSEQVESAVSLDVTITKSGKIDQAGGVLIQSLPDADINVSKQLEENLRTMPKISRLLQEGYLEHVLSTVTKDIAVKELDRYPVDFFCRCSKDRFADSLALVNPDDLLSMKNETEELVCHYCNEAYRFTKEEVQAIAQKVKIRQN